MLASFNSQHSLRSVNGLNTFKPQDNLLCGFSLFPENPLSLPTTDTLLPVITPLSLGIKKISAFLVLCHFLRLVLATLLAQSPAGFHVCKSTIGPESWKITILKKSSDFPVFHLSALAMLITSS